MPTFLIKVGIVLLNQWVDTVGAIFGVDLGVIC